IDLHASMGPEPPDTVMYRFNGSINAPSTAEDPEFEMGTKVEITVSDANGKVLQSTWTTSFPVSVNISNIAGVNSGTITLTYEVKIPAEKDVSTGEETSPAKTEKKVIKRDINFEVDE
ncbi:MAG: serine/threonine-protein kinase, partial [Lachnospiraceae bacterium]|nr:serine/threonine-protein kinase [Lachnospiraceae bacterium]